MALHIKDNIEDAEVCVLTMGPSRAADIIRDSLYRGADYGYVISDRKVAGSDTLATSYTISQGVKKLGKVDLILAGRQAIDGDTAQVGPQIAEHLQLPSITYVEKIEVEGEHIIVNRSFEDGHQVIKAKMPCLITTLQEMNKPRYMNVGRIYEAFNEDKVEIWNVNDIEVDRANLGLKGSPTKVKKSFTKGVKAAGEKFEVTPGEGASIIVENLKAKFII
jgi:electron transfer flavoprotein beta subunit